MKNNTGKPFDFRDAVAESFRNYPALRKDTLFFSTAENPLSEKDLSLHARGRFWLKIKMRTSPLETWLTNLVMYSRTQRTSYAYNNQSHACRALVFNHEDDFFREALPQEKEMSRASSFYHELGHLLCKNGFETDGNNTLGESSADAYAALRLLQRYGDDARGLIARESWRRAAKFMNNFYGNYLTSPVTAQILADAKDGRFDKLSPAETVTAAESYAEKYRATEAQIKAAQRVYADGRYPFFPLQEKLAYLATTCLSKPDNFSLHLGATVLNPFLHNEGVDIGDTHIQLPAGLRQSLTRMIAETAVFQEELAAVHKDLSLHSPRARNGAPFTARPYLMQP